MSEWGNPAIVIWSLRIEYIDEQSELGELKHLST